MRLLTHNHLSCIRKGCTKRYPLALHAEQVEQTESNCNPSFVAHTMIHIDYPVLYNTAKELGLASGLRQRTPRTSSNATHLPTQHS